MDLRSDYGFKFCMQDETVMKSFLNAILEGETDRITSVQFKNIEVPQPQKDERGVNFDLLCTTERGETILIEMQNAPQKFFKTRAAFYISNILIKQFTRGFKWEKMRQDISRIFGIFIMGGRNKWLNKPITRTSVYDRDELEEFWDRKHNFFLSLPNFNLDKGNITPKNIWMHFFKKLGTMDRIDPSVYERADEGLLRLLEKANVANLTEEEYAQYEASMKALEDEVDMEQYGYNNGYSRGVEDGMEKGIQQGIQQGVQQGIQQGELKERKKLINNLRISGFSNEQIAELLSIPLEEVEK